MLTCAGKDFKPVSAQQLHVAAAQLHVGSSPKQLADLELAIQGHFKAPSFAALGHGASLLQCCSDDPVMMQTISAVSPTVPLNKVRMLLCCILTALYACDLHLPYANLLKACLHPVQQPTWHLAVLSCASVIAKGTVAFSSGGAQYTTAR